MSGKRPTITFKKKAVIEKSASENLATPSGRASGTPKLGPIGYSGLNSIQGYIYEEARKELRWPQSVHTYRRMSYDPTIRSALNMIDLMVDRVEWKFTAPEGASDEVQRAVDFLNWNIKNLDGMTWRETIHEIGSYRIYGFHVGEKIFKRVKRGKWAGKVKLSKVATRSQDTLGEWAFSDDGRELTGVCQDLSALYGPRSLPSTTEAKVFIPRNKFMHFRFDPQRGNPEGRSPMQGAYIPHKEKTIIEDYEVVGVSKDLGGLLDIGVDASVLSKAQQNPASSEAKLIQQLEQNAMRMTAGELTYTMTPLAYDDRGNELFRFRLLGIEGGGGKQYNTDDIIRRKQNDILTVFSADVLRMGQDQMGSFALSSNKTSMLANAIEHHLILMADVINHDLVPQLLAMNGWFLEEDEMPSISYGDLEEADLDELGKFIQRTVPAGALTTSKSLDKWLREQAHIPENSYDEEEQIPEEFASGARTRAGDGAATAGEGTSTGPNDDDNSVSNVENA